VHNAGKAMSESHCPRCGAVLNAVATTTGVCSVCRLTLDPAAESIATSDVGPSVNAYPLLPSTLPSSLVVHLVRIGC
jgi:hypothetical protein